MSSNQSRSIQYRLFILVAVMAAFAGNLTVAAKSSNTEQSTEKTAHLMRADFLMTGASCAVCLMRVERKIRAVPGVFKAAVSINSPFPTIIIYDADKTSMEKIWKALAGETVKPGEFKEQAISSLPLVLQPSPPPPSGHD